MELVLVYFILFNKIAITTSFLAFFQFFPLNFPSWIRIRIHADPDSGGKKNADPDPQPCSEPFDIEF